MQLNPNVGAYHLWLGRAYGRKAETVNLVTAFVLARKVVREFERANELDPGDWSARRDLADFYVQAPMVVGGGEYKAQRLANQHSKQGRRGSKPHSRHDRRAQKGPAEAERQYKIAIQRSGGAAGPWLELARFYRDGTRWDEFDDAVRQALSSPEKDLRRSVRHRGTAWRRRPYAAASRRSAPALLERARPMSMPTPFAHTTCWGSAGTVGRPPGSHRRIPLLARAGQRLSSGARRSSPPRRMIFQARYAHCLGHARGSKLMRVSQLREVLLSLAATALLAFSLPCLAEPVPFSRALDLALQHSGMMAVSAANQRKAVDLYEQARAAYLPTIIFGSGLGYSTGIPPSLEGSAPSIFNIVSQQVAVELRPARLRARRPQ